MLDYYREQAQAGCKVYVAEDNSYHRVVNSHGQCFKVYKNRVTVVVPGWKLVLAKYLFDKGLLNPSEDEEEDDHETDGPETEAAAILRRCLYPLDDC